VTGWNETDSALIAKREMGDEYSYQTGFRTQIITYVVRIRMFNAITKNLWKQK
jgi:hypothetical protein